MISFKLVPHALIPDRQVVEIWDDNVFIGQIVAGGIEPGVNVISKHPLRTNQKTGSLAVVEIYIDHAS